MSDPVEESLDDCFVRLYSNIRSLAARIGWSSDCPTLSKTALAHEAYLKLRKSPPELAKKSNEEIISIFANAMRQILVDTHRRKTAAKRAWDVPPQANETPIEDALTLVLAVERLGKEFPQRGKVAEARYLLGMTTAEIALALGLSARTVEREWQDAKAWLAEIVSADKTELL